MDGQGTLTFYKRKPFENHIFVVIAQINRERPMGTTYEKRIGNQQRARRGRKLSMYYNDLTISRG